MSDDRTVHQRMVDVLRELPAIPKNQRNQQQGFMFRGIDDVLNALNPLLAKHGVYYLPDVIERQESERTTNKGGTMYVVHLHVRYTFYGLAGDSVTASAWGEGTDSGDKATNKAMTGAQKYMLFQAFCISTQEAHDADRDSPAPTLAPKGAAALFAALAALEGSAKDRAAALWAESELPKKNLTKAQVERGWEIVEQVNAELAVDENQTELLPAGPDGWAKEES